jgi:hypothetical protein
LCEFLYGSMRRATGCATRCAERDIPLGIVPDAGEALGLFPRRKSTSRGTRHHALRSFCWWPPAERSTAERQAKAAPLGFAMSGLAD